MSLLMYQQIKLSLFSREREVRPTSVLSFLVSEIVELYDTPIYLLTINMAVPKSPKTIVVSVLINTNYSHTYRYIM